MFEDLKKQKNIKSGLSGGDFKDGGDGLFNIDDARNQKNYDIGRLDEEGGSDFQKKAEDIFDSVRDINPQGSNKKNSLIKKEVLDEINNRGEKVKNSENSGEGGDTKRRGLKKKLIFIFLSLIAIAAIIFAFKIFSDNFDINDFINRKPENNKQGSESSNGGKEVSNNIEEPEKSLDTDGDKLTDEVEDKIGTLKTDVDTDKDGLTDGDEIILYKTDPLNPDTDGDSYMDGQEIKSGYDPKGPGKLPEIKN